MQYTEEELVSSDFKGNSYSSIIDGKLTGANGDLIQIAAWYDNECCRGRRPIADELGLTQRDMDGR